MAKSGRSGGQKRSKNSQWFLPPPIWKNLSQQQRWLWLEMKEVARIRKSGLGILRLETPGGNGEAHKGVSQKPQTLFLDPKVWDVLSKDEQKSWIKIQKEARAHEAGPVPNFQSADFQPLDGDCGSEPAGPQDFGKIGTN